MPLYKILPSAPSRTQAIVDDPAAIFQTAGRLACREADVFADGVYSFSVKLGDDGFWIVFEREELVERYPILAFG